jgi:membrane-associated protease RseP (regulator of RpoE activity)
MTISVDELAAAVTPIAAAVMTVDSVTTTPAGVQIRGPLSLPSEEAFEYLSSQLKPLGAMPLLDRTPEGPVVLTVVIGELPHARQRVRLALALFGVSILSCLFVGAQMPESVAAAGIVNWHLLDGVPFAASLLAILLCHEFGHYLMGRRLGSAVSLPYFIPMPLGPFGTLGAFINMVAPPRNRRHLLAVAAAGPLAGLIVALPVLWIGLTLSHVQPLPAGGYQMEGNSLIYALLKFLRFGRLLPGGGDDVFIHPVAFAGWAGLLVTGLNLIPAGQLDGGHIALALFGEKVATWIRLAVLALLAGLSFLWTGWILWVVLIFLFSRVTVRPMDRVT